MFSRWLRRSLLFASYIVSLADCACVPDYPEKLLSDPAVLQHPSVIVAFEQLQKNLSALYVNSTRDGLSIAVVHASNAAPAYTFNNGTLKNNETGLDSDDSNVVTSDSIFRIISVSKNFAMTSALVVENLLRNSSRDLPGINLDTPVRLLLPSFRLPDKDWDDGGSEITLRMLASHTAGVTRESYSTGFDMILNTGKAYTAGIGAEWARASVDMVLEGLARTNLMFAPGRRAAYSNAGVALLGAAVATHYNKITGADLSWSQLATQKILDPLNMTHSFFGAVPQNLTSQISVPGFENWANLVVGTGYDPAAGMWSSSVDLAKYLYTVWLQPNPILITPFQRRQVLKPIYGFQDGKQQVGAGWEILLYTHSTSPDPSITNSTKTYSIFGKSGDGGGWHAWIDVVPNLGYGIVVLTQNAGQANYTSITVAQIRTTIHEILVPALSEALAARMKERFSGKYTHPQDTGLSVNQVSTPAPYAPSYARLEVVDQILYLRELVINGTSALEAVDRLSWANDTTPRYFSTPSGVALEPADGAGEIAQFGEGTQVWRMVVPGLEMCDWFDFDGYKDISTWPLSKLVLVEKEDTVNLHYPPFDIVMTKP